MSRSRASLPAMISPDERTETTLGTMPVRMRGPVRSITDTRLLVVPRSIPTMCDFDSPKSICRVDMKFFLDVSDEVGDIAAAIQRCADLIQRCGVTGFREQRLQFCVGLGKHGTEPSGGFG